MVKVKKVSYDYEADYNEDVVSLEYAIGEDEFVNEEAKRIFVSTHMASYVQSGGEVVIKITESFDSKQWHELKKEIQKFIEQHSESIKEAIKKINDFVIFLDSLENKEI